MQIKLGTFTYGEVLINIHITNILYTDTLYNRHTPQTHIRQVTINYHVTRGSGDTYTLFYHTDTHSIKHPASPNWYSTPFKLQWPLAVTIALQRSSKLLDVHVMQNHVTNKLVGFSNTR